MSLMVIDGNMLEGCGVMPTMHNPLIHIWHIETIHYILVEHDIA